MQRLTETPLEGTEGGGGGHVDLRLGLESGGAIRSAKATTDSVQFWVTKTKTAGDLSSVKTTFSDITTSAQKLRPRGGVLRRRQLVLFAQTDTEKSLSRRLSIRPSSGSLEEDAGCGFDCSQEQKSIDQPTVTKKTLFKTLLGNWIVSSFEVATCRHRPSECYNRSGNRNGSRSKRQ